MHVLAKAIEKAGSFDISEVENALHTLDIKSLVGQIRYNAQGDLEAPHVFVFQVQEGIFTQVFPSP